MTAATTPYSTLQLRLGEPIAHLRLDRPALGNRFDADAHADFADALHAAGGHATTRVIVLSASGKVFSGGGDLDDIVAGQGSAAVRERMATLARRVYFGMLDCPVPIVAAVQGAAIGLGATIVSLCDLSVAWAEARIADPHVAVGLVAGDGGIIGWAQSLGVNRAKRFLLTGEALTGAQACDLGLISETVASADAAHPRALELAGRIAALPPLAVRGTRQAFATLTRQYGVAPFESGLAAEMESMAHPDVVERVRQLRR